MTTAQLKTTVFVKDPDTHQTVELHPGTCPEPRLAALVTNPTAWVDGKLPRLRLPKTPEADPADPQNTGEPAAEGDEPGDAPAAEADSAAGPSEDSASADEEKPPARAAKKTAARKAPAEAAAEGTGGQ